MGGMNKMGRFLMGLVAIALCAAPAAAATFEFHGDFNNRFNLYTNHSDFYSSGGTMEKSLLDKNPDGSTTINRNNTKVIGTDDRKTTWGDIKYRLWSEVLSDDGKIKGVYAVELGAMRFGQDYSKGGGATYSGDGVNIETRWAYTDFALPNTENARVKIGLQPFALNSFVWNETAMGVAFSNQFDDMKYQVAWMRGKEHFSGDNDQDSSDALSVRFDMKPAAECKVGLFALYQFSDPNGDGSIDAGTYEVKKFEDVDMDLYTVGADGKASMDNFFMNWDAMYQFGDIDNASFTGLNGSATGDFDVSAFLLHGTIGMDMGANRFSYTTWYASGDDNDSDSDFDAFLSTDVDRADSIVLFEGGYTDDNYGTERPYILNKGLYFNKLAMDRVCSDKLKAGGALLYMMTAEDVEYTDDGGNGRSNDEIGFEVDAYATYMIYENLEFSLNAGYLFAGNAMDVFEADRDGNADEDIYCLTSRIRFKF